LESQVDVKEDPIVKVLVKDSHTDKKTSSRFKKERKAAISISNKDSKSLSMASQAKFDRKKFLGDLVASKINSSQDYEKAFKHS
jgi:hypothetical protein